MNISSLVVHVRPECAAAAQQALRALPGVEIHAASADGRLVVTVEADSDGHASQIHDRIAATPGVMSAALVYHQFEPDPDQESCHGTADHLHAP
jgi:nitrate reductase NapD